MATLTKQNLINTFKAAREYNAPFVFIAFEDKGHKFCISITPDSFDLMEDAYLYYYNDSLVHIGDNDIRITGLTYGVADDMQDLFSVEG